ncbi:putative penicillin-binding protein [Candidatus Hepatincolaceae symbiont of Richtersius coronifer]
MSKLKNLEKIFKEFFLSQYFSYKFVLLSAFAGHPTDTQKDFNDNFLNLHSKDDREALQTLENLVKKRRLKEKIQGSSLRHKENKNKLTSPNAGLGFLNRNPDLKAQSESYLNTIKNKKEGGGILSGSLVIIGLTIFLVISFMAFAGYYINNQNPLIPVIRALDQNFSMTVLDKKNAKIFEMASRGQGKGQGKVIFQELPSSVINSFVAFHGVLEQRSEGQKVAENKAAGIPSYEGFFKKTLRIISHQFKKILPEKSSTTDPKAIEDQAVLANNEVIAPPPPLTSILGQNKKSSGKENYFYPGCKAYKDISEFGQYGCKFSYSSFLINNLSKVTVEVPSSYVVSLINKSDMLKNYLLIDWIQTNLPIERFLEIYFNYVYFGDTVIGLTLASERYFGVPTYELNLSQSVFLMKKIYDNNKIIYPSTQALTTRQILEQLVINGIINNDDLEQLENEIQQIIIPAEPSMFALYIKDIFDKGYPYLKFVPYVLTRTTFVSSVQSSAMSVVSGNLNRNNIPNASVIVIENNTILAALTMGLEEGRSVFYPVYPNINAYQSLKPFLYSALLGNKKDFSSILLNNKYQNLIFSYSKLANQDASRLQTNNTNRSKMDVALLTRTDLDVVPESLRLMFAQQLFELERNFMKNLSLTDYNKALGVIFPGFKQNNLDTLLYNKNKISFKDMVKAYNSIGQKGKITDFKYITFINEDMIKTEGNNGNSIQQNFIKVLAPLFFSQIKYTAVKEDFYSIVDYNSAYAFSKNYTVGVWFGDLNNNNNITDPVPDYSVLLEKVIKDLITIIPFNPALEGNQNR